MTFLEAFPNTNFNHIGFSGTRDGMTMYQKENLKSYLKFNFIFHMDTENWFHHGDCKGADEEAHAIAKKIGYKVAIHPPVKEKMRAFCEGDFMYPKLPYLKRNEMIVKETSKLVAAPRSIAQVGGTWYTIKFAHSRTGYNYRILPRFKNDAL